MNEQNKHESDPKDRYEEVIFFQNSQAYRPLKILSDKGSVAALEFLKQWHYPGEHMCRDNVGAGTADVIFKADGYIMSYNEPLGYIGLVYDTWHDRLIPYRVYVTENSIGYYDVNASCEAAAESAARALYDNGVQAQNQDVELTFKAENKVVDIKPAVNIIAVRKGTQ